MRLSLQMTPALISSLNLTAQTLAAVVSTRTSGVTHQRFVRSELQEGEEHDTGRESPAPPRSATPLRSAGSAAEPSEAAAVCTP